ncbi:MAG: NTP transferase domain-containing protein, partial [Mycobacterium sp.]
MSRNGNAAGVVLGAGAGTRYGMPKVLAENGDWLNRAVAALNSGGCDQVVVVLGAAGEDSVTVPGLDMPAVSRAVIAADWADGLSASLRAGLH